MLYLLCVMHFPELEMVESEEEFDDLFETLSCLSCVAWKTERCKGRGLRGGEVMECMNAKRKDLSVEWDIFESDHSRITVH